MPRSLSTSCGALHAPVVIWLVICVLSLPVAAATSELTLQEGVNGYAGWEDTWICNNYSNTPQYARQLFYFKTEVPDRQLHRFDAYPVPPGMKILSGILYIYVESVESGTPSIEAFRMHKYWKETEATYLQYAAGIQWWVPGGTYYFDCEPYVQGASGPVTSAGWVAIDITGYVGLVCGGYPTTVHKEGDMDTGLLLKLSTPGSITTCSSKHPVVERRPKVVITYEPAYKVAGPRFSPAGGAFYPSVSVTITCPTPGAEIYYTLDSTTPTEASPKYTEPIAITSGPLVLVTAKAFAAGLEPSGQASCGFYMGYEKSLENGTGGYNGWHDTWVSAAFPTTSQHTGETYLLESDDEDRHLHRFDISSIPPNMKINFARLQIYEDKRYIPIDWPMVSIYRVTKHWVNTEATYIDASKTPPLAWGQPGLQADVDYDSVPLRTIHTGTWETNTLWLNMPSVMQGWYSGAFPEDGIMLKCVSSGNLRIFSSQSGEPPMVWMVYEPVDTPIATPTFDPPGGSFLGFVDVTISCASPDVDIRYTTDGSVPTSCAPLYTAGGAVRLTENTALKARAYKPWVTRGDVASATYEISHAIAKPVISPPPGAYNSDQVVTISCTTDGVTIHYTTDGSAPTQFSPVYPGPIDVTATATIKAIATHELIPDSQMAEAAYIIDKCGPVVSSVATIPTCFTPGVDVTVTVAAVASDATTANTNITAAEYFEDPATTAGSGIPMATQDGSFDSPTEALVSAVNCVSWPPAPRTLYVRARDGVGNWGSAGSAIVGVSEVPPGAITDVKIIPDTAYTTYPLSVVLASSTAPGLSTGSLIDGNPATFWASAGSLTRDEEWIIADIGEVREMAAVALVAPKPSKSFPSDVTIAVSQTLSDNPEDWTIVGRGRNFLAGGARRFVWEFDRIDARYVKVSGPGTYDSREDEYLWQIAEIEVPSSLSASKATLRWTIPTVSAQTGSRAAAYDVRYSQYPMSAYSFSSCKNVPVGPAGEPGTAESFFVSLADIVGRAFAAMKSVDGVGNWSPLSNVATARVGGIRLRGVYPEDGTMLLADSLPVFWFGVGGAVKSASLAVSSSPAFPTKAMLRPGGGVDATVHFRLKIGNWSWKTAPAQWRQMKKVVPGDGVIHWRLEGKATINKVPTILYGPTRSAYFDIGSITGLAVVPSHTVDGKDTVWPLVTTPATFSWTDLSATSSKFFVDVSRLSGVPLGDKANTVSIAPKGVLATSYQPTPAEWKKIRTLAKGGALLYWRVRGTDKDGLLTCGSAPRALVIDGGEWSLSGPGSLSASPAEFAWSTTGGGNGIVAYNLQFSAAADFQAVARITVNVPTSPKAILSYTLSDAEKAALRKLATNNGGVPVLYWRVRGVDAEKAFTAFSAAQTVNVQ